MSAGLTPTDEPRPDPTIGEVVEYARDHGDIVIDGMTVHYVGTWRVDEPDLPLADALAMIDEKLRDV